MAAKIHSNKLVERALQRALTEAPFKYEPNPCPNCGTDMGDGEGDPGANVKYGPNGEASCPKCGYEIPDEKDGKNPNPRTRPPEGGPMPNAKDLDPAKVALALQTAYWNKMDDEIAAYATALNNGGMAPADMLKLSAMLRMMRNGGAVLGALVDAMENEPGLGPEGSSEE